MVRMTMEEVEEDGTHVFPQTWTTGKTARGAIRDWKRESPMLTEHLVKTEVVSKPPPHKIYYRHVGRPPRHP